MKLVSTVHFYVLIILHYQKFKYAVELTWNVSYKSFYDVRNKNVYDTVINSMQ